MSEKRTQSRLSDEELDVLEAIANAWLPRDGEPVVNECEMAVLAKRSVAELRDLRTLMSRVESAIGAVEHDIMVVRQHREACTSGGQHVGTGGPLSAANPSTLVYLERIVRDIRAALAARGEKW